MNRMNIWASKAGQITLDNTLIYLIRITASINTFQNSRCGYKLLRRYSFCIKVGLLFRYGEGKCSRKNLHPFLSCRLIQTVWVYLFCSLDRPTDHGGMTPGPFHVSFSNINELQSNQQLLLDFTNLGKSSKRSALSVPWCSEHWAFQKPLPSRQQQEGKHSWTYCTNCFSIC